MYLVVISNNYVNATLDFIKKKTIDTYASIKKLNNAYCDSVVCF